MNKLSNRIIDFASRKAAKGVGAPRFASPRRTAFLICQWRHDPVTGQVICAWVKEGEPNDANQIGYRWRLANLRAVA